MIEKYLQEIGQTNLLSEEEEIRLAQQVGEGNEKALEQLVGANLRFVVSVAKQYQGRGVDIDDLVTEGTIALIKAARTYNPSRGTRLVVFATSRIKKAMEKAIDREKVAGGMKEFSENENASTHSARKTATEDNPIKEQPSQEALLSLDHREQQVIGALYGINQPQLTLAEVGMQMGVTRERARQIRDKALKKLKKTRNKND